MTLDRKREIQRDYYWRHREEILARQAANEKRTRSNSTRCKRWFATHKVEHRESMRRWREANRERVRAGDRAWRLRNLEHWRAKHREHMRALRARQREMLTRSLETLRYAEAARRLYLERGGRFAHA